MLNLTTFVAVKPYIINMLSFKGPSIYKVGCTIHYNTLYTKEQ